MIVTVSVQLARRLCVCRVTNSFDPEEGATYNERESERGGPPSSLRLSTRHTSTKGCLRISPSPDDISGQCRVLEPLPALKEEVEETICSLKGGKSPGPGSIPAEHLKQVLFLDKKKNVESHLRKHGYDAGCIVRLKPRQFLMPGLVDCHIHSPQLPIQGLGTDQGLLGWLHTYTFPGEARYAEPQFAARAHRAMVRRTLRGGTTSACYFSSIHTDTSLLLCQAAAELGQRAFVGKCNIDQSSPDYYTENTDQSIAETKRFIQEVLSSKFSLVTPVVTPRFAITCSERLMKELAEIARCNHLPIQTHLSETVEELETTYQLFPTHETYTDLYDNVGLLGPKTILAHCVHLSDRELSLLIQRGCGVVHCACSNTTLRSGVSDVRRQLDSGVKMGLGTDVGAGYSTSILAAMRHTVDTSNMCAIQQQKDYFSKKSSQAGTGHNNLLCDKTSESNGLGVKVHNGEVAENGTGSEYQPVTMEEAFRLATLGGSTVMGLNCGNFEPGREFDALLIDPEVEDSPLDLFPFDSVRDVVLRFLYCGDDRNIVKIYVQGREVVDKTRQKGLNIFSCFVKF